MHKHGVKNNGKALLLVAHRKAYAYVTAALGRPVLFPRSNEEVQLEVRRNQEMDT